MVSERTRQLFELAMALRAIDRQTEAGQEPDPALLDSARELRALLGIGPPLPRGGPGAADAGEGA